MCKSAKNSCVNQHDKKNLYGNGYNTGPYFYSYSVNNATSLTHDTTLSMNCSAEESISVLAETVEPYAVYGNSFGDDASCGAVMSVDSTGALYEVIQNYTYSSDSGIHGMAYNLNQTYIYSADDSGNSLWTHKIDSATGELTQVQQLAAPSSGADPRHISVHPSGLYAYVVMEAANTLNLYSIDQTTHELAYTNISYSLMAPNATVSNYKASDVVLSSSGSYAWATTRGTNEILGYLSGYKLSANGSIESQLFVQETLTSQGLSGSVTPSPDTDRCKQHLRNFPYFD